MNFTSRETYLAAVAQWKQDYKELSAQIRTAKIDFKSAQRRYCVTGQSNEWTIMNKARSAVESLKYQANGFLSERAAGKIEAQRQYEEAKLVTA